jgi:hypothetical protein
MPCGAKSRPAARSHALRREVMTEGHGVTSLGREVMTEGHGVTTLGRGVVPWGAGMIHQPNPSLTGSDDDTRVVPWGAESGSRRARVRHATRIYPVHGVVPGYRKQRCQGRRARSATGYKGVPQDAQKVRSSAAAHSYAEGHGLAPQGTKSSLDARRLLLSARGLALLSTFAGTGELVVDDDSPDVPPRRTRRSPMGALTRIVDRCLVAVKSLVAAHGRRRASAPTPAMRTP